MNQRKLTEVTLIIFGAYALIQGISYAIRVFPEGSIDAFFSWTLLSHLLPSFFPSFVYWIIAGMLFWYAQRISCKLFDSSEIQEPTETLKIHEWYRLAFSITGITLLFWVVLPGLLYGINALLFPLDLKDPENDQFSFFKSQKNLFERQLFGFFGNLAEGGIAIYMIMRAKQLAEFIVRIQIGKSSRIL